MDLVHLPETEEHTSTNAGTTETSNLKERNQPSAWRGGDATDILPDEILKNRILSDRKSIPSDVSLAVTIRSEFAQVQRELEAKIEQFDRTCDVCYEDSEVIIYQLEKQKDYEYILDYCEVETTHVREILVELIQATVADRTDEAGRCPLIIRKPHMFRSGERHLLGQLLQSQNHASDPQTKH